MASKIRKSIADIEQAVEEVEQDIERVLVKFIGHVRHNGKDYHAGDTAEIEAASAKTLTRIGAVQPVLAAVPANGADPNNPESEAAPVTAAESAAAPATPAAE